jgi:hypothetical protein
MQKIVHVHRHVESWVWEWDKKANSDGLHADITDIAQNIRRGHGRKVFVKGKQRHVGVGFVCDRVLSKFIS